MKQEQNTTFTLIAFTVLFVAISFYLTTMMLHWMASQNPEPPRVYTSYK